MKRGILHKVILASIVLMVVSSTVYTVHAAESLSNHSPVINESSKRDGDCELPKESNKNKTISSKGLLGLAGQKTRQTSLYLSVKKFASKSDEYIKVDIREEDDFDKYHLAGSINIEPFSLKTKAFLKDKKLIIIDSGYRFSVVEKLASDLLSKGFKYVKILDGGLTSWIRYGGSIDGDEFLADKANHIAAIDFEDQFQYKGWYPIILRNTNPQDRILVQIPNSIEIDIRNKSEQQVVNEINKQISSWLDIDINPEVIFFAGKNIKDWHITRLAEKVAYPNLYILENGIVGYVKQVKKRHLASAYDGRKKGAIKCGRQ